MGSSLLFLGFMCVIAYSQTIEIITNKNTVELGGTIIIDVISPIYDVIVWPFVNGTQWGSDQPLSAKGTTNIIIPFPHSGKAEVVVAILKQPYFDASHWTVGKPLPSEDSIIALSNTVTITVTDNPKYYQNSPRNKQRANASSTMNIMYWEPWFVDILFPFIVVNIYRYPFHSEQVYRG